MCPLTTRHEARSKRKTVAKVNPLRGSLTRKKDCTATFKSVGTAARVHARERHKSHQHTPCDGPRQSGGSTQIPSLTGYEPTSVEIEAIDTEAIEPEDLEPRRIELGRNVGTDPCQIQENFMRNSLTGRCG